jgi:hypothetical protein
MKLSRGIPLFFILASSILIFSQPVQSQSGYEIKGEVLDPDNKPIAGVLIRLYRGPEARFDNEEYRTLGDGKYLIRFKGGEVINTVRYEHSDWYVSTISNISGQRSHEINKTLYRIGSRPPDSTAREILSSLERTYYLDIANKLSPYEIKNKNRKMIIELRKWDISPELRGGYTTVLKLYESSF